MIEKGFKRPPGIRLNEKGYPIYPELTSVQERLDQGQTAIEAIRLQRAAEMLDFIRPYIDARSELPKTGGLLQRFVGPASRHDGREFDAQVVELIFNIFSEQSNRGMMRMVEQVGVRVNEDVLSQVFPDNSAEYGRYLSHQEARIRTASAELGLKVPDKLKTFEKPPSSNPLRLTINIVQSELRRLNASGKFDDKVLAWIKGNTARFASVALFGPVVFSQYYTPLEAADFLETQVQFSKIDEETSRKLLSFYSDQFRTPGLDRKPIDKMGLFEIQRHLRRRAKPVYPRSVEDFLKPAMASYLQREVEEFVDNRRETREIGQAYIDDMTVKSNPGYEGDLDICFSLNEQDSIAMARVIEAELEANGFTINREKTGLRSSTWDEGPKFYEMFVLDPSGKEHRVQMHINQNSDILNPKIKNPDGLGVDIGYSHSGLHALSLVIDEDNIWFYDPLGIYLSRNTTLWVNEVYTRAHRRNQITAPFYYMAALASAGGNELSGWDVNQIWGMLPWLNYPRAIEKIRGIDRLPLYMLHAYDVALRANQSPSLLHARWMLNQEGDDLVDVAGRMVGAWDKFRVFDAINYLSGKGAVSVDMLDKFRQHFPKRVVDSTSPISTPQTCNKYADNHISVARNSSSPYDSTNPTDIIDHLEDFVPDGA